MKYCKHLAILALLGLSACLTPPPPPVENSLIIAAEFREVNPAAVAVLQVEDRTGKEALKPLLAAIRKQLGKSLIQSNYSPMGEVWVDGRMRRAVQNAASGSHSSIESVYLASLAGQAGEDSILAVQISHWDASSLLVNSQVRFAAKLTLFGSAGKIPLISGEVRGYVIAGGKSAAPRDPLERARSAAREFAKILIAQLPRRRA